MKLEKNSVRRRKECYVEKYPFLEDTKIVYQCKNKAPENTNGLCSGKLMMGAGRGRLSITMQLV